jgi:hypothetical protein
MAKVTERLGVYKQNKVQTSYGNVQSQEVKEVKGKEQYRAEI